MATQTSERIAELEAELEAIRPTPPSLKKAHSETHIEENSVPNSVQDRQARRQTLVQHGFSIEQIDGGQPKVDFYRHAPRQRVSRKSESGVVIFESRDGKSDGEVGKLIPNQPGDQNTAIKLATRGVLPWPPSETCECKACRERNGTERTGKVFMAPAAVQKLATARPVTFDGPEEVETSTNTIDPRQCLDCDFVVAAGKKINNSMTAHRMHKHK
jgi:hypothetical protein